MYRQRIRGSDIGFETSWLEAFNLPRRLLKSFDQIHVLSNRFNLVSRCQSLPYHVHQFPRPRTRHALNSVSCTVLLLAGSPTISRLNSECHWHCGENRNPEQASLEKQKQWKMSNGTIADQDTAAPSNGSSLECRTARPEEFDVLSRILCNAFIPLWYVRHSES